MVFTKKIEIDDIPESEILRYMRAGRSPNENVIDLMQRARLRVLLVGNCASCYIKLPIQLNNGSEICTVGLTLKSEILSKKLYGCEEMYVFCATAGVGVDREIQRTSSISQSEALATDACGSALVEAVCDRLQEFLALEEKAHGREITDRFSPGYADLSLDCQSEIIKLLDAKRHIGVGLTDTLMLTPHKSVTAIIGVKKL